MGFFSDLFWSIRDTVENVVDSIKDFLNLGSSRSYTGTKEETVDIESVLNKFKDDLEKEAKKRELDALSKVMREFDHYINANKDQYPDLAEDVERRKEGVRYRLRGTIRDYINPRLTLNDDKFKKILELQPGEEKKNELSKHQEQLLKEGEIEFKKKLKTEMEKLYREISQRMEKALTEQKEKIAQQEQKYIELSAKIETGQLSIQELEHEMIPVVEASRCINFLFGQMEK